MDEHVKLGDHVRDPITGFTGAMTSRTEFLNGCVRIGVTAFELDKDGKEHVITFDIAQVELVEAAKFAPRQQLNQDRPPGGPEIRVDTQAEVPGLHR